MADDWSIQASYKFGNRNDNMLNIRGNSPDDFLSKVQYLTELLNQGNVLSDVEDALAGATVPQAVENVQAAVPGTQVITAQPAAPLWSAQPAGGVTPICSHGPMKDLAHKNYKSRFYCGAPYGTPREAQCPPRG